MQILFYHIHKRENP